MRTLLLAFALQTILSTAAFGKIYYTVKFPDDRTVYGCPAPADTTWPEIIKQGNCNINVGVSVKDQVFFTNGSTCGKILRTWKIIWWCDYDPNWMSPTIVENPINTDVGPWAQGNDYNHGFLQYTQVIKFLDPVAPTFIGCPTGPVTFCDLTENDPAQYGSRCEGPAPLSVCVTDACSKTNLMLMYRLFLDLDGNGSMETFLSSSNPAAWPIETTVKGDTLCGQIKFPPGHGFPYGKHKIEWIANDNCGNEALCKYEFIIKDCKPPTVVCTNGLSINIMQTGMITLWDTDFLQKTYDNCTPDAQLKIGIRKAGAGTGFPTDSHSVTFDCTELGIQEVEIWSLDAYGNRGYCTTYVIIQDNIGACPPPSAPNGTSKTAQSKPVAGVKMMLKKTGTNSGSWTTLTDSEGAYAFANGLPACGVLLSAALDTLDAQGLSTLDALLAAAHHQGIAALGSPYQIIAADANHDGVVDGDDLLDIIKLVTAQTGKLPEHTSWMFVPESYVFPNPANPFSKVFPETMSLNSPQCYKNVAENFVAIKIGDVNESLDPNQLTNGSTEDRKGEIVTFTAPQTKCKAGQEISIPITTPYLDDVAGFQFTLDYDSAYLQLQRVEPGLVPTAWTGLFPDEHFVTGSWHNAIALDSTIIWKGDRKTAMTLVFKVIQSGSLGKMLSLNSAKTTAEAYTRRLSTMGARLAFVSKNSSGKEDGIEFTVYPNPVRDEVKTNFYLDEPGQVSLRLTDPSGNTVQTTNATFAAGFHEVTLTLPSNARSGMLFLHLQTTAGTGVQKVVVVR